VEQSGLTIGGDVPRGTLAGVESLADSLASPSKLNE
jgi:hypothetical protein